MSPLNTQQAESAEARARNASLFNPEDEENHPKRTRTVRFENVEDPRYTKILDQAESEYGRVRAKSRYARGGRPYEYAIQLPAWKKGTNSWQENNAKQLNSELIEIFGRGYIRPMPRGLIDTKNGYIKIAASKEMLEQWAEDDGLRVKVKPWRGGGYRTFSRERQELGWFAHQGCRCEIQDECTMCCTEEGYEQDPGKCDHLVLLPYQIQNLVRSRVVRAFDNWHRDLLRQKAKEKGQNVMVTTADVAHFLNRFVDENKEPTEEHRSKLLELFKDTEGDVFQHMDKSAMCHMVSPHLGDELAECLHTAVQRETDDDVVVPPGRGLALALKEGKVKQLYPLHTLQAGDTYMSRRQVLTQFCGWKTSFYTVLQWGTRSREFLNFLREYLGEKVALYFAFLHFYTTWLLPLGLAGIVLALAQYFTEADNIGVPVYCLFVALWGTLMIEFWKRRAAHLAWEWNTSSYEETETELFDFVDDIHVQGIADLGFYESEGAWVDMSDYYKNAVLTKPGIKPFIRFEHRDTTSPLPNCMFVCVPGGDDARQEANSGCFRLMKEMMSLVVILVMVAAVVSIAVALLVLRLVVQDDTNATFGGAVNGVLQAIVISVLDKTFEGIAVTLNNFENHRTATQYEDRLIAKQFFFQFVSNYFSLFYIAFFKGSRADPSLFGYDDSCKGLGDSDSCMAELSYQLTAMLLTRMIIGNIVEWAIPHYRLKASLWQLWRQQITDVKNQRDDVGTKDEAAQYLSKQGLTTKTVDVAEKQGHQPPYNQSEAVSGTFYDYAELVIQFGYVTLFAPAFPLAPFIAILSNVVENRNDGYKILLSCQKPDYMGAQDMGTWLVIFRLLSYMAVMTNVAIIAFTSNQLDEILNDPSLATKIAIVVLAEHLVIAIQLCVQFFIPSRPYWVRVTDARIKEIVRAEGDYNDWRKWTAENAKSETRLRSSFADEQARINYIKQHSTELLYEADVPDEPHDVEDLTPNQ